MTIDARNLEAASCAPEAVVADAGPLGLLPRLSLRQARIEERLARVFPQDGLPFPFAWLADWVGNDAATSRPEIIEKSAGLRRPGLIALLSWPRLATRIALGVENPLAHAVVDRLLGFDRLNAESRLQLTPVEWGVLTFVLARSLEQLAERPALLGPWDLALERVGADPFNPSGLGEVTTLRWSVRIGSATGSVRLWLPATVVARWLAIDPPPATEVEPAFRGRCADLTGHWRADAGTITLPRGSSMLRVGMVVPLIDSGLMGSPQSPGGPVALALALTGCGGRFVVPAEPAPFSGGGRLKITGPLIHEPAPREAIAVNPPPGPVPAPAPPTDVPLTLTVELGRVHLTLRRLADLKPGDVLELGRHSREPVELTSGGRLVARGELVQIDTELGVRILNVYL